MKTTDPSTAPGAATHVAIEEVLEDGPALLEAAGLFDAYRVFYERAPDGPAALEFLRARVGARESRIFLARTHAEAEGAIGFCQLYPAFTSTGLAKIWILNDLFVDPGARGRGVGAALLERARRLALDTGAIRVDLATARANVTAQRLYEKTGFVRDEAFLHYSLDAVDP